MRVRESNNVLQAVQTNQTLFIKLENKRNVLRCLTECLTEIKLRKTSSNIANHGGQTSKTCFIKQCWIFYGDDDLFGRALAYIMTLS